MPRIRSIKPDFFVNDELGALSPTTRLLFIGLWTQADREGRLHDRPKRLKVMLLPYDDVDIEEAISELADSGHIIRYIDVAPDARCSGIGRDGTPRVPRGILDDMANPHFPDPAQEH